RFLRPGLDELHSLLDFSATKRMAVALQLLVNGSQFAGEPPRSAPDVPLAHSAQRGFGQRPTSVPHGSWWAAFGGATASGLELPHPPAGLVALHTPLLRTAQLRKDAVKTSFSVSSRSASGAGRGVPPLSLPARSGPAQASGAMVQAAFSLIEIIITVGLL